MKHLLSLLAAILFASSLPAQLPELIPYRKGYLWGYCDTTKKIIIPCRFGEAGFFEGDSARVQLEGKSGYILKNGDFHPDPPPPPVSVYWGGMPYPGLIAWAFPGAYTVSVAYFIDEKAPRPVFDSIAGLYGYKDGKGKQLIPPRFISASWFSEDLAAVQLADSVRAYIDRKGRTIARFPGATWHNDFRKGRALVTMPTGMGMIDTKGKWVVQPVMASICQAQDMYRVVNYQDTGRSGFLDATGKMIVPCTLLNAADFSEGLAAVQLNDTTWGYIDRTGRLVVRLHDVSVDDWENRLAGLGDFDNGVAIVRLQSGVGLLGKDGKWVALPVSDEIVHTGNMYIVGAYDFLVLDASGHMTDNRVYSNYEICSNGMVLVHYHDQACFLDENGRQVTPMYYGAEVFSGGYAAVTDDGNKWGFVSEQGKLVIPMKYDCAGSFDDNGLCMMCQQGYIDFRGRQYWEEAE